MVLSVFEDPCIHHRSLPSCEGECEKHQEGGSEEVVLCHIPLLVTVSMGDGFWWFATDMATINGADSILKKGYSFGAFLISYGHGSKAVGK